MEKFIDSKIEITEKKIDEILAIGTSYDLLKRKITIGDKNAVLYFINGFCDEDVMEKVIEALTSVKSEDIPNDKENFIANIIPYIETSDESNEYNIITAILSGIVCLIVDGYESAFLIDAREYPARGVEEPEKYKVLRGSRDGFVETLVYNTALIRRRIRSPEYRCEITQIGECSRTDVAICYIEGRVDKEALNLIKDKLANAKIDALAMNQESLAECIYKGSWINPFPKFRYTERPDTVAASVINGQIAVLVDNSPAAMLLPTTVFDAIEEAGLVPGEDIIIISIMGTNAALEAIVDGKIACSVECNPLMGDLFMEACVRLANGEEIEREIHPVDRVFDITNAQAEIDYRKLKGYGY